MRRRLDARIVALLIPLLACSALAARAASPAPPASDARPGYAPRPMPMPADFLPVPANAAALPPRRCPSGSVRTEPKDLITKDERARRMMSQLRMWGDRHFRFEGPAGCTDFDFVISQWQATVGLPQTGVLAAAEVASVVEAITKIQPQLRAAHAEWSAARGAAIKAGVNPNTGQNFTAEELERRRQREQAQANATSAAPSRAAIAAAGTEGLGPEPVVLDFLPTGAGPTERECSDGLAEAQRWALQQAQLGRMSPGVVHGPGAAYAQQVPEHWGRLSQQYGEIGLWTQSRSPAGCPARTKLRAWLKAIGDDSKLDDPRSTIATERYVRELRARLHAAQAQYASDREAWLARQRERAAAVAADPAVQARVRSIDFAGFPPGAQQASLAAALPPALCTRDGNRWNCARATNGCRAEERELADRRKAVDDASGRGSLAALFGGQSRLPPDRRAELQQRATTATLALERCRILFDAGAEARSELRFGPATVDDVVLSFEGGRLVEMDFVAASEREALRNLMTRRYGAPQVRAEQRRFVTAQFVPGLTPDDDEVIEHVSTVDVAHETWSAGNVVVRGSEGKFTMLLTDASAR